VKLRAAALGAVLAFGALRAGAQQDSLLDRAARNVRTARTMQASFEQSLTNPDLGKTTTSRGEFVQQGAAKFAFRFTDPAGDAIVADGAALWVYLPSSARGQVLKLSIAQGAQLDLINQLLTAPRTSYMIANGGVAPLDGADAAQFTLTPKVTTAPFTKAVIWIDTASAVVRQIEATEPSGLIRRIRFRNVRTDGELRPDALTFVVPPNVKVLDATSLLGGRPPARD
jgi:outer membrane lipoprotein carrier protein